MGAAAACRAKPDKAGETRGHTAAVEGLPLSILVLTWGSAGYYHYDI